MEQEAVNLAFIVEGAGAATVIESNALFPTPPPPTGPMQQHGWDLARLRPTQASDVG